MCKLCDENEEHSLVQCEDAAVLLYGDPYADLVFKSVLSARQIVESGLDLT